MRLGTWAKASCKLAAFILCCTVTALPAQEIPSAQELESEYSDPGPAPQVPLPTSQELEAQGAVIGEIRIVNNNVFATETPEENYALFRLANRLHIRTRQQVLGQQLLFKSGDRYVHRLQRESERILRTDRYLYDAEIVPVRYRDGVVDIEVRTRDVWTFKPGIQYGRSGGANTTGFELQESNLLGFGKEMTVGRKSDVDRTSTEARYYDPHVFGTWNQFLASYQDNSDGHRRELLLEHPFYSLDSRWLASGNWFEWERTNRRYSLGHIVDEFRHKQEHFQLTGGSSSGWRDGWIRRLNYGMVYDRDYFAPSPSLRSAQQLPENRVLSYPFIGITWFQDDYEERRNQNQIQRTEDLYAGTFLRANVGWANETWGADRNAWILRLGAGTTFESAQRSHTMVLSSSAIGRFEDGELLNGLLSGNAHYYWRISQSQLFYAFLHGTATHKLDAERQLLLGGDNGLRGYPLRYQDGAAAALLTLEHRIYTNYYLFRLFHLGGAVFFDMGRTWGRGNAPWENGVDPNQGTLKNLGLGLRFGSSRSAFGNVIHVDLAFPLDGDPSIKRVQFVVETKTSF